MLNLDGAEEILEKMKLRFLIQEKAKIAGAEVLDSVAILRDDHLLVLLLFDKRPKKIYPVKFCNYDVELWLVWKRGKKVYVQDVKDQEIIPLEAGEIDAFIDLMLQ
ncbi:hypothetical protein [Thermococcus waiotapuensis]|uniref:Uncharacterized protein n=1 Tax=Thermococcus waiotapuensis TaxID=90909 RepID=A0AAE4NWP6_9EURY|nr:hypothetical protein [Thermococcus waiotapuensis]MDV3104085.1 hypothetical protein [Thermococcus waiotapuensis]